MDIKAAPEKTVELKRELGLLSATNLIISTTIGSGIFVTPGSVLYYSGSVGLSLVIWAFCGLTSILGALAYAELASLVPKSGSEYIYFMEAFGSMHKFWGPLPSFLYAFVDVFVVAPVAGAIVILTSAEYIMEIVLYFVCVEKQEVWWATKLIALTELGLIAFINCRSVKLYKSVQDICTGLKILICLVIVGVGLQRMILGNYQYILQGFEGSTTSPLSISLALYNGMFSYTGASMITLVTQEVKKPEVNILRSALISVPLVTILYLFMNLSYLTALSPEELMSSEAVGMAFGRKISGAITLIISIGVLISTFGSSLSAQFAFARLCFVASQSGHLMDCLSYVQVKNMTPVLAVVILSLISAIVVLTGDIIDLIEFAGFVYAWVTALAMVALLVLRKRIKDIRTPIKVPVLIPVIVGTQNIFLFIMPLVSSPDAKYLAGLACIGLGFLLYFGIIYKKTTLPKMDVVTHFLQSLFEIIPQEKKAE